MTKATYEATVAALRASPFAATGSGVEESDWSARRADGPTHAYRRASLRVVVTTGAEASAVAASFAALALSVGEGAGVAVYVHDSGHGVVAINASRDLDADEVARLAVADMCEWEHPAETLRYTDVPA